ncbi:acetate--CoA ligase family protein [Oryzobacter telluris]|uniref:acetate--CoA ligase family protein n=1 Tax=Oryzobacter telluris TaxID=3149179 RepID=UPI00370D5658
MRTISSGLEVVVVHPSREHVFGLPTHTSLLDVDGPVDAVFSMVGAASVQSVVDQAASMGAGGVVVSAGGFADAGDAGRSRQLHLADTAAAAGLPVVGPNSAGLIDVTGGADLSLLPPFERRKGGVSIVAHSGAALEAVASLAWRSSRVGFSLMVSSGNEMSLDVADYVLYLADDPSTSVIAVVLEAIRRPSAFFDAVECAHRAGKPVVVLKLGRSERSLRVVESHTGAIAEEDWVFQIAARQYGIEVVADVPELVDRIQFFDQLDRDLWPSAGGVCVWTMSGGFAALAADLSTTLGLEMPTNPALDEWVRSNIPGAGVANPLDATGFAVGDVELWGRIVDRYLEEPAFGTFLFLHQLADWDEGFRAVPDFLSEVMAQRGRPLVISPYAGDPGAWVDALRSGSTALGNGLSGSLRGIHSMAGHAVKVRTPTSPPVAPPTAPPIAHAAPEPTTGVLPFVDAMALLTEHGIDVAPFHMVAPEDAVIPPAFPGPYVAKLAEVAHRARIGAVATNVEANELTTVVARLRSVAEHESVPAWVVIQPQLTGREAFIGMSTKSALGPVVAAGRGGGGVEQDGRILGRMAPFSAESAAALALEVGAQLALDPVGARSLQTALESASALISGGVGWIETMDINPLIETPHGFVAVDALCIVR